MMIYQNEKNDTTTKARAGYLNLPHGQVPTPAFMPVGTNATVKALLHDSLERMDYKLILGNTYHLYLRPGAEVFQEYGSLHNFSTWQRNILTDSGGFQVFSLSDFRKIQKEGVKFRSHIDGSYHLFTPESVVDFQVLLNSDIQMVLDVCTASGITEKKAKEAVYITSEWAKRAKTQYKQALEKDYQGHLFGIIQGNFFKELRKMSAEHLLELDFPGYAIGGLSVGESADQFEEFLTYTAAFLPADKPRYIMGIGTPDYILLAVENGIDMFDCVLPTRIARNGSVFTREGVLALKKQQYALDTEPIEEGCPCTACQRYSRGYLRHLIRANEILASVLCTEHNLQFMKTMMDDIRQSILEGRFATFKKDFLDRYQGQHKVKK